MIDGIKNLFRGVEPLDYFLILLNGGIVMWQSVYGITEITVVNLAIHTLVAFVIGRKAEVNERLLRFG